MQQEIKENRTIGGENILLFFMSNNIAYFMKKGLLNLHKASQKNVQND